jgi:predicted acyl esterase
MPGFDADGLYPFFPLDNLRWTTFIRGRNLQSRLWADDEFWAAITKRIRNDNLSVWELPSYFGPEDSRLSEMVRRFVDRDPWSEAVPGESQMRNIAVPSLTITGTGDNAQRGALRYWLRMREAKPDVRAWLVIGPWVHSGEREAERRRTDTPASSELDRVEVELLLDFYAHILHGSNLRTALGSASNLAYISGGEEWLQLADEDLVPGLRDEGRGARRPLMRSADKRLQAPSEAEDECAQAGVPDATLFETLGGEKAWNNSYVRPSSDEVITMTAGTLQPDTRLIGLPELHLAFTAPLVETDLYGILYVEWPDGDTRILSTAQLRLSLDDVERGYVRLNNWRFVAIEVLDGAELKLQLSGFDDPGYIAVGEVCSSGRFAEVFQPRHDQSWLALQETRDKSNGVVSIL